MKKAVVIFILFIVCCVIVAKLPLHKLGHRYSIAKQDSLNFSSVGEISSTSNQFEALWNFTLTNGKGVYSHNASSLETTPENINWVNRHMMELENKVPNAKSVSIERIDGPSAGRYLYIGARTEGKRRVLVASSRSTSSMCGGREAYGTYEFVLELETPDSVFYSQKVLLWSKEAEMDCGAFSEKMELREALAHQAFEGHQALLSAVVEGNPIPTSWTGGFLVELK